MQIAANEESKRFQAYLPDNNADDTAFDALSYFGPLISRSDSVEIG